jgi:hypothetical protein
MRPSQHDPELVVHLLAEEDQPGRAGDWPRNVDRPEWQLGQLGNAIPAEAGEPDAGPQEHDGDDQHAEPCDQLDRRLGTRRQARPEIDLEMGALAHPDHGPDHDRPDEQEPGHLLGPDVVRDDRREARKDLQGDGNDEHAERNREQP